MVSYFGGKQRMAEWIAKNMLKDVGNYVEPFSGAYWVYVKGDIWPDGYIVYNDMNRYMVNLFACAKEGKKFLEVLESVEPQDHYLFDSFQDEIFNHDNIDKIRMPDYDFGMKYAYVLTQVFSGTNPSKGKFIDMKGKYESKYTAFKNKFKDRNFRLRMRNITNFENMDFQDVIEKYDNDRAFFYCDPPYYGFENDGKQAYALNDFCKMDHERLAKVLKNIKGHFSLSYYDFPELEKMYPKDKFRWLRKRFKKAAGAIEGQEQSESVEILIMNY